ncbi:MAG: ATP-binding cassette domain-containing protein [Clostridiales bacterium]|jgi:ABC-type sugar transport system ATPase subunit|nr:ATP-binding cassette domain-containing protein [Clostridiales bacterium]
MEYLKLENVCKQYLYGVKALNNISFSLPQNGRMTVFGGESAGKTTLLKIIAGLLEQTEGGIFLQGKNAAAISIKDRNISMSFADAFKKHKTLYDNLYYSFLIRGKSREVFESRLKEADGIFAMNHMLFKKYGDLNAEERAVAVVLRCLMRDADLYILDNPLKDLQQECKKNLLLKISDCIKNIDGAVIYAADDFDEACFLNFRTLILNYGSISGYGNLNDIYNKPDDLYACKLFGMNVIKGNFIKESDKIYFQPESGGKILTDFTEQAVAFSIENSSKTLTDLTDKTVASQPENGDKILTECTGQAAASSDGIFAVIKPEDLKITESPDLLTADFVSSRFEGNTQIIYLKNANGYLSVKNDNGHFFEPTDKSIALTFDIKKALFYSVKDERIL